MPVMVRTFNIPRWMGPFLILAALALIPFALVLAFSLGALAVGLLAVRTLLPGSARPASGRVFQGPPKASSQRLDSSHHPVRVLDAEYEVKETHEKE